MDSNFLKLLADELGEIRLWEKQCPGVYYLSVQPAAGGGGEYYAVLKDAPISQEVRAMGRPLENVPVLAYPQDEESGARAAVEYEVLRYQTTHGLPLPKGASLRETALYGMELCPDYFGTARWTTGSIGWKRSSAWRYWRFATRYGPRSCRRGS